LSVEVKERKVAVTVYLPESLVEKLRKMTVKEGVQTRSLSDIVRELVIIGYREVRKDG